MPNAPADHPQHHRAWTATPRVRRLTGQHQAAPEPAPTPHPHLTSPTRRLAVAPQASAPCAHTTRGCMPHAPLPSGRCPAPWPIPRRPTPWQLVSPPQSRGAPTSGRSACPAAPARCSPIRGDTEAGQTSQMVLRYDQGRASPPDDACTHAPVATGVPVRPSQSNVPEATIPPTSCRRTPHGRRAGSRAGCPRTFGALHAPTA